MCYKNCIWLYVWKKNLGFVYKLHGLKPLVDAINAVDIWLKMRKKLWIWKSFNVNDKSKR